MPLLEGHQILMSFFRAKNLGSTKAVDELPDSALPEELRAVRTRLHEE